MMNWTLGFSLILLSLSSIAEDKIENRQGPCKQVLDACKKFVSDNSDKSLYKDCMQPLLSDKSTAPTGLTIDMSMVDACKKKKIQLKQTD